MKGIFLNIDINTVTFPFLQKVCESPRLTEEDLYPFIDQYANTEITDISLCIFCQISMTPSKQWSDVLDSYHRTEENGIAVDFKPILAHYHKLYEQFKIDPHEVWIRRCREKGLTSYLSVRMNDCHCPDDKAVWIRGKEFYEADEKGWKLGEAYGYQRHCYDYSEEEFRRRMLSYIEEQIMRYDADGLELDFSREWYCFRDPDTDMSRATMTGFVREVSGILRRAEEKWKHPLRLHLRVMRDIQQNRALGFDLHAMAKEGLLDSISVAPRWASNDSDMPIESFKHAYPSLPVYAGITDLTLLTPTKADVAMGYAAAYLARGADKIYLYNFFSDPYSPSPEYQRLYRTCGSLKTLVGEARRIVVTLQDMTAPSAPRWSPLPERAQDFAYIIPTGPIRCDEQVSFLLGFDREAEEEEVTLTVNGKRGCFLEKTEEGKAYAEGRARLMGTEGGKAFYLFGLSEGLSTEKELELTLHAKSDLMLSHIEVIVK